MAKRSTRILNDTITMNCLRHRLWHGNVCHHRLQIIFNLWYFLHARYHRDFYIIMNRMKPNLNFWRMQSQLNQISVAVLLDQFWISCLFSCTLWFLNVDLLCSLTSSIRTQPQSLFAHSFDTKLSIHSTVWIEHMALNDQYSKTRLEPLRDSKDFHHFAVGKWRLSKTNSLDVK